ncbi:Uncharacterised protein [Clostridium sporogenes]|nr:Uncharacterised protein [Clostridium sporogenes]
MGTVDVHRPRGQPAIERRISRRLNRIAAVITDITDEQAFRDRERLRAAADTKRGELRDTVVRERIHAEIVPAVAPGRRAVTFEHRPADLAAIGKEQRREIPGAPVDRCSPRITRTFGNGVAADPQPRIPVVVLDVAHQHAAAVADAQRARLVRIGLDVVGRAIQPQIDVFTAPGAVVENRSGSLRPGAIPYPGYRRRTCRADARDLRGRSCPTEGESTRVRCPGPHRIR